MTKKYFLAGLLVGVIAAVSGIVAAPLVHAQNSQVFYCNNNQRVEIPASAQGGITADQACANSGGASQGQTYKCNDGTTVHIPSNAPGGITADQACANSGGASGAAPTTSTPQLPADIEAATDDAFMGCKEGTPEDGCGFTEKYLNPAINLLAAATGMIVIIMIIVGGIQYASAGGDASKVAAAKSRIANAVLAVIAFLFLYAVLQWLVPGGFF